MYESTKGTYLRTEVQYLLALARTQPHLRVRHNHSLLREITDLDQAVDKLFIKREYAADIYSTF
jgi:hypothetical protein